MDGAPGQHAEAFRSRCASCHGAGGSYADYIGTGFLEIEFHNTGLYNIDGKGTYPAPNTGVHAVSEEEEDMGRFKAPSLRNIAETAPYMHDGSIATLEEVTAHYEAGRRHQALPLRSEPHEAQHGRRGEGRHEAVLARGVFPMWRRLRGHACPLFADRANWMRVANGSPEA